MGHHRVRAAVPMRFQVFVLLLAASASCFPNDPLYREIAKRTGSTAVEVEQAYTKGCESGQQSSMNRCMHYRYVEIDVRLNEQYQLLLRRLAQPNARKALVSSQRAWVAYRDANCVFDSASVEGGSMRPMAASACLAGMTKERATQFEAYLNCRDSPQCHELKP